MHEADYETLRELSKESPTFRSVTVLDGHYFLPVSHTHRARIQYASRMTDLLLQQPIQAMIMLMA